MTLLDKIVTPNFVAFNAHCFFSAFWTLVLLAWFPAHAVGVGLSLLGAALVKELYIDKHFESAQSFEDNLLDFTGYFIGICLGTVALELLARHYA